MNLREDKVYLEDIAESVNIIFQHVKDMTEFEFSTNILVLKDMRNKLSHEYFGVSMSTIYTTVKEDLPVLLEHLKKMM